MHDASRVRVGERPGDLAQPTHGVRGGERAAGTHALAEILALDEGHRKERMTGQFVGAEHGDDIRMRQPTGGACLTQKKLTQLCVGGEMRRQHFDGDESVEPHVACEKYRAHAAASELAFDGVLRRQRGPKIAELGADRRWHERIARRSGRRRHGSPKVRRCLNVMFALVAVRHVLTKRSNARCNVSSSALSSSSSCGGVA